MSQNQCEHETTWRCLLYRAYARSMKKHGATLNDQAKQCLACHKNKRNERMKREPKSKDVAICQLCGRSKTCKKCHGAMLCSSCICVISMIKKTPEVMRRAWRQYGPDDTPLGKSPITPAFGFGEKTRAFAHLIESRMRHTEELDKGYVLPTSPAAIPAPKISMLANHSPFSDLLGRMAAIHNAKKHDYASNEDCLGNFREARRLGITPLQGIMVRLTDKYTRACNWVRRNGDHAVKDERLEDTLLKLANYSCLAILAHGEAEEKAEGEEDHNAKDVHQDHWTANSTGDLSELPKEVPVRGEEEEEQVEG